MECKICYEEINESAKDTYNIIHNVGKDSINKKSEELGEKLRVEVGDAVHKACRKPYMKRKKKEPNDKGPSRSSRSKNSFDFRTKCFVCGNAVTERERKTKGCVVSVMSKYREVDQKLEAQIAERGDDPWAIAVNGRLQCAVSDLHAEDAIYHAICYSSFILGQPIPLKYSDTLCPPRTSKRGRPHDPKKEELYEKAVNFLLERNREDEVVTLGDLKSIMEGAFTTKWIKTRLQTDFPDELVIANVRGKEDVVTFTTTANKLLTDFHQACRVDPEKEKVELIKTAAQIIKNEIVNLDCDMKSYPKFSKDDLSTDYLPPMLDRFLEELVTAKGNETKRASLGQAIMQCTRPRSLLCPVQVGLGIQLHTMFGSRLVIDLLHNLGYCISYSEVIQFESCAAFHQNINLPQIPDTSILHYAADNVDHNIRTLDGHNTFHGMGIIAIITRGSYSPINVPRRKVTSQEILSVGTIEFKILKMNSFKDTSFKFQKLSNPSIIDNTKLLGTLWQSTWILKPDIPQWNGYMQSLLDGSYPGKSSVHIMPMIDEKSSDYSCIYTTMVFISKQAKKYGKTPLLTFDQPLYWKAIEIQRQMKDTIINDIILILGSFHTLMSYLGSIGHLMIGTGLQSLLEQIYAESTVPHILSGKAVSRARRAHLLASCALEGLKIAEMYNVDICSLDDGIMLSERYLTEKKLKDLADLLEKSFKREVGVSELTEFEVFRDLLIKQEEFLKKHQAYKTSKVWILYMEMVDLMNTFIKAERTGNFRMHIQAMNQMLPYLAASGHFNYTKSAYCYLQQMQELPQKNPEIYQSFIDGYNVVRRNEKFWAGIGTDLMIEQELMRSLKTTGGLTHGRGMTELQRTKWVLSTTTNAAVKQEMEEFAKVRYESSEQHIYQHKESSTSRCSRDKEDALKLLQYLEFRNPFDNHDELVRIDTGEEGELSVNVDQSQKIGQKIIDSMVGKPVLTISFSKKDICRTMKLRTGVEINGETVNVDPLLLFQRLLVTVRGDENQLQKALCYELCSHPPSLVGNNGLMLEADKPNLSDEIWRNSDQDKQLPSRSSDQIFVIDGGNLLFKVKWMKGSTFEDIFHSYEKYILKHYGPNAIVVFDGYPDEPTTKDTTHLRRKSTKTGRLVKITSHMKLNTKKETFLATLKNKNLFNNLLTAYINERASGILAIQDRGDADYLIAKTAIDKSRDNTVIVIGADTDILVLLLYGTHDTSRKKIFLTSESISASRSHPKVWDIYEIRFSLGDIVCNNILAIHAFFGCDTVSRIYGLGKGMGMKKFLNNEQFKTYLFPFSNDGCSQTEIAEAGERVLLLLYGGDGKSNLNDLRYSTFCRKTLVNTKAVQPETLPPTSDAAYFHSLRVYHQVQSWKGNNLPAEEWGWLKKDNILYPKLMTFPPAPLNLLKIIKCSCKTGCAATSQCSCRKNMIKCTSICGNCKGVSCLNHQEYDIDD